MTDPALSALRFGAGLALGAALGLVYGFLRPLRTRRSAPADLLFMAAAFYAWLVLSFAVCRGDIRLGITLALPLGALLWENTAGRLLRRPFRLFWQGVAAAVGLLMLPFKKFYESWAVF